ncbi:unnamed protein product [Victoria cruziana]
MPSSDSSVGSFLRQLSHSDPWSSSKRWSRKQPPEKTLSQMQGLDLHENGMVLRKRVMVVVDSSTRSKHAMMWALTHVANKGDLLTLLQIIPPSASRGPLVTSADRTSHIANSLGSLCKACRPEPVPEQQRAVCGAVH